MNLKYKSMTTDDLREKYGLETKGKITYYSSKEDDDLWTDDYVLWLEEKLLDILNG